MKCPNCNSKDINRIGKKTFFCKKCFHEIQEKINKLVIFEIGINGVRHKVNSDKNYS